MQLLEHIFYVGPSHLPVQARVVAMGRHQTKRGRKVPRCCRL